MDLADIMQRDAGPAGAGEVVDADSRSIRVVMSTDAPVGGMDPEDGDVIDQSTWMLDRWARAGSPILDGHYMGPGMCGGPPADVIGNGSQTERATHDGRDALLTTIRWDLGNARGADLARQYGTGVRSAFSVGFVPRKQVKRTALAEGDPYRVDPAWSRESGRPGGRLFRDVVLLELSAVTVGADPHALAVRGLDRDPTWGDQIEAMVSRLDERGLERVAGLFGRALGVPAVRDAVLARLLDDDAVWATLAARATRQAVAPLVTESTRGSAPPVDPWISALAAAWRSR
jgi:hypothetical protein